MKPIKFRRILKKINPARFFRKIHLVNHKYGIGKKGQKRKELLLQIAEKEEFIKEHSEYIKKFKMEAEAENNEQKRTAVKIHLEELWGVMKETDKLREELASLRKGKPVKKYPTKKK